MMVTLLVVAFWFDQSKFRSHFYKNKLQTIIACLLNLCFLKFKKKLYHFWGFLQFSLEYQMQF